MTGAQRFTALPRSQVIIMAALAIFTVVVWLLTLSQAQNMAGMSASNEMGMDNSAIVTTDAPAGGWPASADSSSALRIWPRF